MCLAALWMVYSSPVHGSMSHALWYVSDCGQCFAACAVVTSHGCVLLPVRCALQCGNVLDPDRISMTLFDCTWSLHGAHTTGAGVGKARVLLRNEVTVGARPLVREDGSRFDWVFCEVTATRRL